MKISKAFSCFEEKTGVKFKNKSLLIQAFTHSSCISENSEMKIQCNEKLEFFGDSVLGLVMAEYLYKKYPLFKEGELTEIRGFLTRNEVIAEVAKSLDMGSLLLRSNGFKREESPVNVLADCFEAFIGAIYLDQGYKAAFNFVVKVLTADLDKIASEKPWRNPRNMLQQKAQHLLKITPVYEFLERPELSGENRYLATVLFNNVPIAQCVGGSKSRAGLAVAQKALQIKGWLSE